MEKPQLVTLEELEALYEKAEGLRKDIKMPVSVMRTALEKHLFAERLLQMDYNDDNWECSFPDEIIEYAKLWMKPLVWTNPLNFKDLLIDGRVAVEQLYPDLDDRYFTIRDNVEKVYEQAILAFADNPSVNKFSELNYGIVKGMHNWHLITKDYKSLLDNILIGNIDDEEEENEELKDYNSFRLQYNLTLIAEKRGGKRAAELLRMLRTEWPKIKQWKTGLDTMTEEEIAEFEDKLFNGLNVFLEEWEGNESEPTITSDPDSAFFAVTEKMTYDICKKELLRCINSAKNKADACREIMRSATAEYFVLSDKTDSEKANAINPWVALSNKNYVFTGDDFRKARNS